jgi:hypothetical protein
MYFKYSSPSISFHLPLICLFHSLSHPRISLTVGELPLTTEKSAFQLSEHLSTTWDFSTLGFIRLIHLLRKLIYLDLSFFHSHTFTPISRGFCCFLNLEDYLLYSGLCLAFPTTILGLGFLRSGKLDANHSFVFQLAKLMFLLTFVHLLWVFTWYLKSVLMIISERFFDKSIIQFSCMTSLYHFMIFYCKISVIFSNFLI